MKAQRIKQRIRTEVNGKKRYHSGIRHSLRPTAFVDKDLEIPHSQQIPSKNENDNPVYLSAFSIVVFLLEL